MTPDPCQAHKRMSVPAVLCLENIVNKLASIAESTTAHPNEMQIGNAYFMPRALSTCMCTASKCINLRCSCAIRQMGCS